MGENFLTPGYDKYSDKYMKTFEDKIKTSFDAQENANSIFKDEESFKEYCSKMYSENMKAEDFCKEFATTFNIEASEIEEVFTTVVDTVSDGTISKEEFENFATGMYELNQTSNTPKHDNTETNTVQPSTVEQSNSSGSVAGLSVSRDKNTTTNQPSVANATENNSPVLKGENTLTNNSTQVAPQQTSETAETVESSTMSLNSDVVDSNYTYKPFDTSGLTENVITKDNAWSKKDKVERKDYTDSSGTVRKSDSYSYSSGKIKSSKIYDENGKLIREELYSNGKVSTVKILDDNGNVKEKYELDSDGHAKEIKTVDSTGAEIKYRNTFKNGVLTTSTRTNADETKDEYNYSEGKLSTVVKKEANNNTKAIIYYDSNGNIEKEHRYIQKDGKKLIEIFDANGKSTGEYLNLDGTKYVEPTPETPAETTSETTQTPNATVTPTTTPDKDTTSNGTSDGTVTPNATVTPDTTPTETAAPGASASTTLPDNNAGNSDVKGNLAIDEIVRNSSVISSNYKHKEYDVTGLEEHTTIKDSKWSSGNKIDYKTFLDSNGNVRKKDNYSYSPNQVKSSEIYDENGKLIKEESYSNGKISSETVYDENGQKKEKYTFDKDGYAKEIVIYDSNGAVKETYTNKFKDGNLTSVTKKNADGTKEEYTYNSGKVTESTSKDADNNTVSTTFYNDNGEITKIHNYIEKDGKKVIEVCDKDGKPTGEILNTDNTPYVEEDEKTEDTEETEGTEGTEENNESNETTFSENASDIQKMDSSLKAQRLIEAMESLGTEEQDVYDIIMDDNLKGEELVKIMEEYAKQRPDHTLIGDICGDFSCNSETVTEETLRNRIFELLQQEVNAKTEYDNKPTSEALSNASKFAKIFNGINFFGIGHGDVTDILDNSSEEDLVQIITAYTASHPDKNFMEEFCGESWYGSQEKYIAKIINAYQKVLSNQAKSEESTT